MKAIQIKLPASLENLTLVDMAEPLEPGQGEIKVRIRASSLNFHDFGVVRTWPNAALSARASTLPRGGDGETAPVSAVAKAARPQRPKPNVQGFVEPLP